MHGTGEHMNNIHKNCFAYQSNSLNGCAALKELYCRNEECKFYKTERDGKYPNQLKKNLVTKSEVKKNE